MNKTSFEEIKLVNCLILVLLAEILSHKINPSGCINRYGSSPFIKPKAWWLANVFENIMWLICHDMTRSSRVYDKRLMILTLNKKFKKQKCLDLLSKRYELLLWSSSCKAIFEKHWILSWNLWTLVNQWCSCFKLSSVGISASAELWWG